MSSPDRHALRANPVARYVLTAVAIVWLLLLIGMPVATVIVQAFGNGLGPYLGAITDHDAIAAIKLTLLVVIIVVPLNTVFGLAAAWAIAKFEFPGKRILTTLVELPLAISPVVSGFVFVLIFGSRGLLGPWLSSHDIQIIFAIPGIVIATLFVTAPMVARELIPLMQAHDADQEEAAVVLGANGWQTFWYVTLPRARYALLYGTILCAARAMGEFGAVAVVSGHIRGKTNTIPLHVETLYNEYNFQAAFAVASLLLLVACITLAAKRTVRMAETGT